MTVSKSDVIWAYRNFLGREPENDRVVQEHCGARDMRALCEVFLECAEFRARSGISHTDGGASRSLPIFMPRLSIDTSADTDELGRLWKRVRRAWESLGDERPYHSVLTDDRYTPAHFPEFEPQFWQSGEDEAERLIGYLAELRVKPADAVLLDYGSGVGRVTVPLAGRVKSVVAYEISERHLNIARARAAALGRKNFRTVAIGDELPTEFEPCQVFYSRIVLQHNPPPVIGHVIRRLIRALTSGGVGIFQVPTYFVGYRFNIRDALRAPQKLDMDMHCYPQPEMLALISQEGARLLEVREDDAPGRSDLFVSNTFVLSKD